MGGFDISLGLGLGLGLGSDHDAKTESDDHHVSSSPSLVSSLFSNSSSIKRERDQFTSDDLEPEVENNNIPSNGNLTRKKLRLTKEQSVVLEDTFKHHSTIHPKQKQELARKLNLETRQVEVWFQNRRARTKLKQTEVECEVLKKCYEKLSEENKRLKKEMKELKTMKTTTEEEPFYMQFPVATHTVVCPSCKRISGGGGSGGEISTPTIIGPMPRHHIYTFTQSSAAC